MTQKNPQLLTHKYKCLLIWGLLLHGFYSLSSQGYLLSIANLLNDLKDPGLD